MADYVRFPAGFEFGASTAAYQVEGAAEDDGRAASIWDTFCAAPGRIRDASSGAVAADHYHRYAEDVALMARLGLDAYRFSFSWSRIQPAGTGRTNAEGLAFYDRLIDGLLDHGIKPMATVFHWDLPQALQDRGGWMNRDTAERFAEYAMLLGMRFADRVERWIPVNEPNVFTAFGHALGIHAPGERLMFDALPVAHHALLGHGRAVQALRSVNAKSIGTATNHSPVWPASESAEDVEAARTYSTLWNRLFADPILLGAYPTGFAELMPGPVDDDLRVISAPLDFYGVNYYNPTCIAAPSNYLVQDQNAPEMQGLPFKMVPIDGYPRTDRSWPVVPDALRDLLAMLAETYGDKLPPVIITENGCSYDDGPDADGRVADQRRIEYLDGHLRALRQAMDDGVDVLGYYTWSLMDNFEWEDGYTQRFGLVHVDYDTQRRTPKDSFHWYAAMIAAQKTA